MQNFVLEWNYDGAVVASSFVLIWLQFIAI